MPTLTKFSDSIKAIRTDGISINAAATKTTTARERIANMSAAAISTNPKTKAAYDFAKRGVERLGFSLDQVATAGAVRDLDKRMSELKWDTEQRIALKTALAACGAIA
jgi:hypothetical protein